MKRWLANAWRSMRPRLGLLFGFVGALWLAHLVNVLLGGTLTDHLGLVPRRIDGLIGVPAMPFLHGDWNHLTVNTAPALILGGLILLHTPRRFIHVTLFVVLVGGMLIWLFARPDKHIGASGLIFGWFGFVVAIAFVERSGRALLGAAVAVVFYGAPALWGLSPLQDNVSWDGHLAGLVSGVICAWVLRERRPRRGSGVYGQAE